MHVPTVKVKNKASGEFMIINELDYAQGTINGINISSADWERVSETHGDGAAADAEAENQRLFALKLEAEAAEKEKAAAHAAKSAVDGVRAQAAKK